MHEAAYVVGACGKVYEYIVLSAFIVLLLPHVEITHQAQ
jgi:hypothetical protein